LWTNGTYSCINNYIGTISQINCCQQSSGGGAGILFSGSINNIINNLVSAKYNYSAIKFSFCQGNIIRSLLSAGSTSGYGAMIDRSGWNQIFNWNYSGETNPGGMRDGLATDYQSTDGRIYSSIDGRVSGAHSCYGEYVTCNIQSSVYHGTTAWMIAISNAKRNSTYPFNWSLVRVSAIANTTYTISVWVKKDHATNVGAGLLIQANQLPGIGLTDIVVTKSNDINWQQLQIQCTPTVNATFEIMGQAWYVAGNSNVYFDSTITVTH
jgi:hypothetical protein